MLLIVNARVWTMSAEDYDPGYILVDEGKIISVGPMDKAPDSAGMEVVDAAGQTVMPGIIDAHCHIGCFGEGIGQSNSDGNEMLNPLTPYLRGAEGVNPQDMGFPEALSGGVTCVCTGPGSTNVFGGTFAILKTYGKSIDAMAVKGDYALKVALGENPKRIYKALGKMPSTRMATAALFRQEMEKARAYQSRKDAGKGTAAEDFYYGNLLKVLRREMPLKIHAHRADDIQTAMRLADEFGVDCTLDHCTEGYKITDVIKKKDKRVILGPVILSRCKVELGESRTDNAVFIQKAGIPFCIATDSPCVPVCYLSVSAGYVCSQGLPEKEALKAITIYPAKILGIADRMGSIEPGKDADLVFLSGHLFDMETRVLKVLVEGKTAYEDAPAC